MVVGPSGRDEGGGLEHVARLDPVLGQDRVARRRGRPHRGPRAGRAEAAQAAVMVAVAVADDDVGRRAPRQDLRLLRYPRRAVGRAEPLEHEHALAAGDDAAVAEGGERRAVVRTRRGDHGPDAVADLVDSGPHLAGRRGRLRPRGPAPAGREPGRGAEKTTKDIASCHLSVPPGGGRSERLPIGTGLEPTKTEREGRPRTPRARAAGLRRCVGRRRLTEPRSARCGWCRRCRRPRSRRPPAGRPCRAGTARSTGS